MVREQFAPLANNADTTQFNMWKVSVTEQRINAITAAAGTVSRVLARPCALLQACVCRQQAIYIYRQKRICKEREHYCGRTRGE